MYLRALPSWYKVRTGELNVCVTIHVRACARVQLTHTHIPRALQQPTDGRKNVYLCVSVRNLFLGRGVAICIWTHAPSVGTSNLVLNFNDSAYLFLCNCYTFSYQRPPP